jgi:hypothetical protein
VFASGVSLPVRCLEFTFGNLEPAGTLDFLFDEENFDRGVGCSDYVGEVFAGKVSWQRRIYKVIKYLKRLLFSRLNIQIECVLFLDWPS